MHGDLETIYQASIQARDLVRQILAFSRKHEVLNEPTDIAARVREALHMLHASVPSTIEIVERIAPIQSILAEARSSSRSSSISSPTARMRSATIADA